MFAWIKDGRKTIDVRKGKASRGETAVFQSGPRHLRLQIIVKETGKLTEIVRADNYRLIIPSAETRNGALGYLRGLYGAYDGLFTAYYLAHP